MRRSSLREKTRVSRAERTLRNFFQTKQGEEEEREQCAQEIACARRFGEQNGGGLVRAGRTAHPFDAVAGQREALARAETTAAQAGTRAATAAATQTKSIALVIRVD